MQWPRTCVCVLRVAWIVPPLSYRESTRHDRIIEFWWRWRTRVQTEWMAEQRWKRQRLYLLLFHSATISLSLSSLSPLSHRVGRVAVVHSVVHSRYKDTRTCCDGRGDIISYVAETRRDSREREREDRVGPIKPADAFSVSFLFCCDAVLLSISFLLFLIFYLLFSFPNPFRSVITK